MSWITIIDSQIAGLSGDMILSALIDLGANEKKVIDSIYRCENYLSGSKIIDAKFKKVKNGGFNATQFNFKYKDSKVGKKGIEIYRIMTRCCDGLDFDPKSKIFALNSLKTLINAEAQIHGERADNVHTHEIASIDTFADLIGCATALEDLKIFKSKIFSTHVLVGNGLTTFSHGTIPNPTNAVLEIFKGKTFVLSGSNHGEVTTPTGASMLVNLTSECIDYYPNIIPEKIGLGSGHKRFINSPNVLRIVFGRNPVGSKLNTENIFLIETNIDDLSGEIIGSIIETLMKEGARDVTILPGITKKNRPTNVVRIITDALRMDNIIERLYYESGTAGIRIQEIKRVTLNSHILITQVTINNSKHDIKIKIIKDRLNNIVSLKPEFEDLKKISKITDIPVKRVSELAMYQISSKFGDFWNDKRRK